MQANAIAIGAALVAAFVCGPASASVADSSVRVRAAEAGGPVPSIDAASPGPTAVKNNVSSTTSPSFLPPAGTVLYAVFSMDSASYSGDITKVSAVRNSGLPLKWHLLGRHNAYSSAAGGFVEVWWAANPAKQSDITVTGAFNQRTKNVSPPVGDFQVFVMDNAAADQSSASWHARALLTDTGNTPEARVTTSRANSLVLGVFDNWNSAARPTPDSDQAINSIVLNSVDVDGYWVQKQKASTPRAGTSVLMRAHDPGMATQWRVLAWEVLGPSAA